MSDTSDLEQDIAETRSRLSDTIGEIQSRLTVSGIVDEVLGQAGVPRFQGGGPDFVMGLLKRHPVPVMVSAAVLGFLIHRSNQKKQAVQAQRLASVHPAPLPPSRAPALATDAPPVIGAAAPVRRPASVPPL